MEKVLVSCSFDAVQIRNVSKCVFEANSTHHEVATGVPKNTSALSSNTSLLEPRTCSGACRDEDVPFTCSALVQRELHRFSLSRHTTQKADNIVISTIGTSGWVPRSAFSRELVVLDEMVADLEKKRAFLND